MRETGISEVGKRRDGGGEGRRERVKKREECVRDRNGQAEKGRE